MKIRTPYSPLALFTRQRDDAVGGGLPAGGLAFRRIWETSGEGELLLRWVPRR